MTASNVEAGACRTVSCTAQLVAARRQSSCSDRYSNTEAARAPLQHPGAPVYHMEHRSRLPETAARQAASVAPPPPKRPHSCAQPASSAVSAVTRIAAAAAAVQIQMIKVWQVEGWVPQVLSAMQRLECMPKPLGPKVLFIRRGSIAAGVLQTALSSSAPAGSCSRRGWCRLRFCCGNASTSHPAASAQPKNAAPPVAPNSRSHRTCCALESYSKQRIKL